MRTVLHSICLFAVMAISLPAALAQQVTDDIGLEAVRTFIGAVAKGDPAVLDAVLAPEFQIVRANGETIAKEEFLAGFPASHSITGDFSASKLHATGAGDVMVVSYALDISESIEGAAVAANAPRMTVFRYVDGAWQVSAHANFGAIASPK
jgi:ketosteroid isomerase-like protein